MNYKTYQTFLKAGLTKEKIFKNKNLFTDKERQDIEDFIILKKRYPHLVKKFKE